MPEAQVGASSARGLEIVHAFGHWPRAHAPFFLMLGSFTPCCLSLTPHKTSEERPDSLKLSAPHGPEASSYSCGR